MFRSLLVARGTRGKQDCGSRELRGEASMTSFSLDRVPYIIRHAIDLAPSSNASFHNLAYM